MAIIGVKGHWALALSAPLDKLTVLDIKSVKLISEAGNVLPSAELEFELRDKKVFHELGQGKILQIAIGVDENSLVTGNYSIFSRKKVMETEEAVLVKLILTHASIGYTMETKVKIYNEKSLPLINQLASESGFTFSTNIPDTMDKMKWVQSNISNRTMVNKLWFHSKLANKADVMLIGITPDSKLHCRSLEKTKQGSGVGKWAFVPDPSSPTNGFTPIIYSQNLNYKSFVGTVDYLSGYSQTRIVHNVGNKESNYVTPKSSPTLAQTEKDESVNPLLRYSTSSVQLDSNMHPEWYDRQDYVTRSLIKLNAHTIKIICESQYAPCDVTDIAFVFDRTADTGGLWLIKKVCHRIYQGHYTAIITVCRDNPNEVKND